MWALETLSQKILEGRYKLYGQSFEGQNINVHLVGTFDHEGVSMESDTLKQLEGGHAWTTVLTPRSTCGSVMN